MPGQSATKKTNKAPPKSTSKVSASDSGPDHDITAERSGEFQESLDELEGSNILILDTGSEWRVLDDAEVAADDSSIDDLRFDDNTPLPDDFGANDPSSYATEPEAALEPIDEDDDTELLDEEPQPDVALSEPDEWKDILGEFMELAKEVAAPIKDIEREAEQLDMIEEQTSPEDKPADEPKPELYVPPMTEEEHTANMQIDQELMAIAVEDDDGFISTIVIPEDPKKKKARKEKAQTSEDDNPFEGRATAAFIETIVLEGESIRTAVRNEQIVAEAIAVAKLELADEEESVQPVEPSEPRHGMIAAVVLLSLALAAQVVHQSRESLATSPAFNNTVGLIYRAIGQPIQPAWDITGWRFEASKGSTQGEDEDLTVYSRLGNNSEGALPYPLIGISLTDRFEESIGSRVLNPAEYLPRDLDPRKLLEQGDTFNAVITIESASEDATGFKLNVCYRSPDEKLRCAIDDFK
jgi:hypothetical protein